MYYPRSEFALVLGMRVAHLRDNFNFHVPRKVHTYLPDSEIMTESRIYGNLVKISIQLRFNISSAPYVRSGTDRKIIAAIKFARERRNRVIDANTEIIICTKVRCINEIKREWSRRGNETKVRMALVINA